MVRVRKPAPAQMFREPLFAIAHDTFFIMSDYCFDISSLFLFFIFILLLLFFRSPTKHLFLPFLCEEVPHQDTY